MHRANHVLRFYVSRFTNYILSASEGGKGLIQKSPFLIDRQRAGKMTYFAAVKSDVIQRKLI